MTTETNYDPRFVVTLAALREAGACFEGYNKLVRSLQGEPFSDEDLRRISYIRFKHVAEIPLTYILSSNGLEDAIWTLRCVSGAKRDTRLFAVWCARQVEHVMGDQRSKDALDIAERFANGEATEEQLDAARAASWDAARAASWDVAARAASWTLHRSAPLAAGMTFAAAAESADSRGAQEEMFARMCLGTAPWQQAAAPA